MNMRVKRICKSFWFLIVVCSLCCTSSFSQINWKNKPFEQKVFVENKGQFEGEENVKSTDVKYAFSNAGVKIFFTPEGLTYCHDEYAPLKRDEQEERERGKGAEEVLQKPTQQYVRMSWIGANSNPEIVAEEKVSYYFTYVDTKDLSGRSALKANAFRKIIYKDLYPNIDVEYSFPDQSASAKNENGVKYSLILHSGADPSVIKMKYANASGVSLDSDGNTIIKSAFGNITDHAPKTFYADNHEVVPSAFSVKNNIVSFSITPSSINHLPRPNGSAGRASTIIIDPWTTVTTFASFNSAYDVDYDMKGNVYIYGGSQPFQEMKYNSSGVIQWVFTHPVVAPYWFGGFYGDCAVDHISGSSYIGQGVGSAGATKVAKLNSAGVVVGYYMGDPDMDEIWRITLNNCTHEAIIATANHNNVNPAQAAVLDTNVAVMTFVNVLSAPGAGNDPCMLAIDNYNNCFMDIAKSVTGGTFNNMMAKFPANTLAPTAWIMPDGYSFRELLSVPYVNHQVQGANGFNGIAVNNNFLYTYDGSILKKWDKGTGAVISSVLVYSSPFRWGGLDVDECDNIFVGGNQVVKQYDVNLVLKNSISVPDSVYDVKLGPMNKLYVCGAGFVEELKITTAVCNTFSLTTSVTGTSCSASTGSASVTVNSGTPPYTYLWNPTGQTSQTITGLSAGTYVVVVTDNACVPRQQSDTILVTSASGFTVTSTQSNPGCGVGNTGSSTVNVAGGTGPFTYNWSPSGGTSTTASGLAAGNYTVTVTDAGGCTGTNTFAIVSSGSVTATAGPNSTICAGQTLTLNSSGGANYAWSSGQSTSSISIAPTTNTTYSVIVSNGSCADTAFVTVVVNASPVISVSGNSVLCLGDISTLTASGGTNCSWSNGNSSATINVSPSVTTTYTVFSSNSICTSTVPVTVTVSPPPIAAANNAIICAGQNASLMASGGSVYSWSNGATTSSIILNPSSSTTYSVIVSIGTCSDTTSATITVGANPIAAAWNSVIISSGGTTTLAASGGGTYVWDNGAIDSVISVSPTATTRYCVTVSNGSCTDSACVMVYVEPTDCTPASAEDAFVVPSAFSPNKDGQNDAWRLLYIPRLANCIAEFQVYIYDRWGEKVFEGTDISFSWDGTYKGQYENTAVFGYYITGKLKDGKAIKKKGNISLIR